jgi:ArsR family transcriptional regulator, arsenate/arsenite/antimonite-responsive transcriptional repressor
MKNELEKVFKALGDSTRLRILEVLKKPGKSVCDLIKPSEKGLCACDIEDEIGLSQAAISHHMDILCDADLVISEKRGRWMFYSRNEEALNRLSQALLKTI